MTEQEIINTLKENKTKGIAYLFLPEDVWEWIGTNFNDPRLIYLAPTGRWEKFSKTDFDDYDNIVFALPEYYKIKQESIGEWTEFEIDQKGNFHCFIDGDMHYFFWANWNVFLTEADSSGYTAFGGWQYEDDGTWFTTPQMFAQECFATLVDCDEICKPAIPIKIRFWRESR